MDTDNWGWTRFVDIKWDYSFEDAKKCWLWNIINNSNLDCFNPNRYWINPTKLMNIDWSWTYKYTFSDWSSSFSTPTENERRKCLWHSEYMTIMAEGTVESDWSNTQYIRLWQNFCKESWEVAWRWISVGFMNYDDDRDFWEDSNSTRESSARDTKLYFR
jgi:hypothetical protein